MFFVACSAGTLPGVAKNFQFRIEQGQRHRESTVDPRIRHKDDLCHAATFLSMPDSQRLWV
jgi:hypothetical protein